MKTFAAHIDRRLLVSGSSVFALALVVVAAASASAPFNTQMPTFTQQGNTLTLTNGGWMTYSSTVDRYVFRFTRNGVLVKGPAEVPMTSPPDEHLVGEYPNEPQANVYELGAADNGQTFCGEVWGGTHSVHYYANGNLAYDVIEWGHTTEEGTPARVCTTISGASGTGGGSGSSGTGGGTSGTVALAIGPAGLPTGTAGFGYPPQTLQTSGGTAPYSYSLTAGSPPPGLTLSSAGQLSGTPTSAGRSTFTVQAQDAAGKSAKRNYTIDVVWPKLTVTPAELPAMVANAPVSLQLAATGGIAPYTFTLAEGTLPRGLELGADGLLSGTPSAQAGLFRFKIAVSDAYGAPASVVYSLLVTAPTLALPTDPPSARVRVRYRFRLSATGGAEPYRFAKIDGSLPPGLALAGSGVVSGKPTRKGTWRVWIRVYDANGASGERLYRFVVR